MNIYPYSRCAVPQSRQLATEARPAEHEVAGRFLPVVKIPPGRQRERKSPRGAALT